MKTLASFLSVTALLALECPCASEAVPLYRDYNPTIIDHFYTISLAESQNAVTNLQYNAEGVSMLVFSTQVPGSVRFYRLYSAAATDHFYTTNPTEAAHASGYVIEDMSMYIYPTQMCGTVPIYRLYYSARTDHFYTLSTAERDSAATGTYTYEGIAGYAFESTVKNIPYCK
ncbi:hypothetical protein DFH08DRAFT_918341 [Mycena albidolilacea]|uniref:DUF5648 domain-containing protein n=1 Tax=Mycena albidolilacea TaxID=1033008 RepID=A0AAD6Z5Y3_9AGAR|nr:hypothetical protein DFH08DRAFT_918341 [Mycena albidolilacea]